MSDARQVCDLTDRRNWLATVGGAGLSNKGGDSLQQSDYRVLYQMAMGLKAQLMASLNV